MKERKLGYGGNVKEDAGEVREVVGPLNSWGGNRGEDGTRGSWIGRVQPAPQQGLLALHLRSGCHLRFERRELPGELDGAEPLALGRPGT